MHAHRKDRLGDLIPVIVAATVAVVGQTFAGSRQRDDHGRGGVKGRRNRDSVRACRRHGAPLTERPNRSPAFGAPSAARLTNE
jgi:hypothetical protein